MYLLSKFLWIPMKHVLCYLSTGMVSLHMLLLLWKGERRKKRTSHPISSPPSGASVSDFGEMRCPWRSQSVSKEDYSSWNGGEPQESPALGCANHAQDLRNLAQSLVWRGEFYEGSGHHKIRKHHGEGIGVQLTRLMGHTWLDRIGEMWMWAHLYLAKKELESNLRPAGCSWNGCWRQNEGLAKGNLTLCTPLLPMT